MAMVSARRLLGRFLPIVAALLATASPAAFSAEPRAPERELKAVFLYNFTKYTSWPPEAFGGDADSLVVCVLGRDPFGTTLDQTLSGEVAHERKLVARRLSRVEEAAGCQLVFVSSSEERDLDRILKQLDGKSVLTVGETDQFAERGGVIRLRRDENKIRFEINLKAAERAGLKISSQLLKLGKIVSAASE